MQVVDAPHRAGRAQGVLDLGHVEMGGRALEEDVDRLAQQRPGARQDEEGDERARDDVGAGPAGEDDHEAGHDHEGGADRVAEDLEVRAAHVEALRGADVQQPHARQVHEEAQGGHHQDGDARDVRRLPEPLVGGDQDGDRHHAEHDAVDERGQDLHAVVAVGLGRRGRALGEPDREQAQQHASRVHQHVGGVGEEREAAGPEPDRRLHHQECGGQPEDGEQAVLVAGAVGVPAVHGAISGPEAAPAALLLDGCPGSRRTRRGPRPRSGRTRAARTAR